MNFNPLRRLRTSLSRLLRRGREEAALDAEMRFHFDALVDEFRATGLSDREARLAARREFGPVEVYREEVRDTWCPPWLAEAARSVRFAARSLVRTPGFTVVAVVTLSLGIGANTAMFSVLNGIMLKPLPYPAPAQLEAVYRVTPQDSRGALSVADFLDLQAETGAFASVAGFAYGDVSLSAPGEPAEFADAIRVTSNFFATVGIRPAKGRDLRAEEMQPGRHRVLVISDRFWRNHFGGAEDVVGRTVRVDGEPFEIVGVMPPSFNDWRHLGWVDLFRPFAWSENQRSDRSEPLVHVIGRRDPAVAAAVTAGRIASLGQRVATDFPAVNAGSSWRTLSLHEVAMGSTAEVTLGMLVGLSGLVLLIACSNLANLLLARTVARAREFAVRGALGASRWQLLRPLLLESLVLALLGGAGAIGVALGAARWLAVRSTGDNGEQVVFTLDWNVLVWAFVASLVTAVFFGLAPALFALRLDLNGTLKSGGRGASGGRGHRHLRHLLIVGQFALAMVLLAGAAVFVRGLDDLNNRRGGWESDGLVIGNVLFPAATYPDTPAIAAFARLAVERLEALPGVASASMSYVLPFFNWYDPHRIVIEGRELPEPGHEPAVLENGVSPRYFETVGTPLIAGRTFNETDRGDAPRVFVINQAMADALFAPGNPLGQRMRRVDAAPGEWGEIVGVVANVKSIFPEANPVTFQVYQPLAQRSQPANEIAVRTAGVAPAALVERIRDTMMELDPDLPVRGLQPATDRITRANYQLGVLRDMLSAFALLGLGLAALGIYGVIARTVALRTGEFGIRMALGARVADVVRLVLSTGVKLALIGAGIGLVGAVGIAHVIAAEYPNMRTNSGAVIVGVTIFLVLVALVACYLPARRAARIDPTEALRAE